MRTSALTDSEHLLGSTTVARDTQQSSLHPLFSPSESETVSQSYVTVRNIRFLLNDKASSLLPGRSVMAAGGHE